MFYDDQDALFYRGSKVLTQQLKSLNQLLKEINNNDADFKFVADQASEPVQASESATIIIIYFLFLGIFLTVSFLFFKNLFKSN